MADGHGPTGGLPLDQYSASVPPGWRPGMAHYPFRRFMERLRLFYRMTSLGQEQVGPALAGRLQGKPFNIAMDMKITNRSGNVLVGDAALAYPGEAATVNLAGDPVPGIDSGVQQLCRILQDRYGQEEDTLTGEYIDAFLDLRRGRNTLLEYLSEFSSLYDKAELHAGLSINAVGLTHMLLKHCGIEKSKIDHILLLENHDRTRFQAIYNHLKKMAKEHVPSQLPGPQGYYGGDSYDEYDGWNDDGWNDDGWYDDGWNDDGWTTDDAWYQDGWQYDNQWTDDGWQAEGDWAQWGEGWGNPDLASAAAEQPSAPPATKPPDPAQLPDWSDTYYGKGKKGKGKGKGKGSACPNCGSSQHDLLGCPWHWKGKGEGKSEKGKSWYGEEYGESDAYYGKGKGKGKKGRKGKKGKGKGKGKGKKGYHGLAATLAAGPTAPSSTGILHAQAVPLNTSRDMYESVEEELDQVVNSILDEELADGPQVFNMAEHDSTNADLSEFNKPPPFGRSSEPTARPPILDSEPSVPLPGYLEWRRTPLPDYKRSAAAPSDEGGCNTRSRHDATSVRHGDASLFNRPPPLTASHDRLDNLYPHRPKSLTPVTPLPDLTTPMPNLVPAEPPPEPRKAPSFDTLNLSSIQEESHREDHDKTIGGGDTKELEQESKQSFLVQGCYPGWKRKPNKPPELMLHMVRGVEVWGAIFDPGASDGLCGTQTLVEYQQQVLWPHGLDYQAAVQENGPPGFRGIDGVDNTSRLRARIPVDLGPTTLGFECETIGGTGHRTPFLYSNLSCKRRSNIFMANYFDNGDGLLIFPHDPSNPHGDVHYKDFAIRLLFTDSGHYLIPIDHGFGWGDKNSWHQREMAYQTKKAMTNLHTALLTMKGHAAPGRTTAHFFTFGTSLRECLARTVPSSDGGAVDPAAQTTGYQSAKDLKSTKNLSTTKSENTCLSAEGSADKIQDTNMLNSIYDNEADGRCGAKDVSVKKVKFAGEGSDLQQRDEGWGNPDLVHEAVEGNLTPRTVADRSRPTTTKSAHLSSHSDRPATSRTKLRRPPGLEHLPRGTLHTTEYTDDGDHDEDVHDDVMRTCHCCKSKQNTDTVVPCAVCCRPTCPSCMTPKGCSHCAKEGGSNPDLPSTFAVSRRATAGRRFTVNGMVLQLISGLLCGWSTDVYKTVGDQLIKDSQQPQDIKTKYKVIPDEFYQHYQSLPVITPKNVDEFLEHCTQFQNHTGCKLEWDFWEICSLSARTTLVAAKEGLAVGFPVDYRHGWNLMIPRHREKLEQVRKFFKPRTIYFGLDCRIWCVGSEQRVKEELHKQREAQSDMLHWVADTSEYQTEEGGHFIIEQPDKSKMMMNSPISRLTAYHKSQKGCQCAHGAQHPENRQIPIRKCTQWLSDLKMKHTAIPCRCTRPHGELQGRHHTHKLCNTTLAAVYPRALCRAIVRDLHTQLTRSEQYSTCSTLFSAFWSCPRCRGDLTKDHSRIQGKCGQAGCVPKPRRTAERIAADNHKTPGVSKQLLPEEYRRKLNSLRGSTPAPSAATRAHARNEGRGNPDLVPGEAPSAAPAAEDRIVPLRAVRPPKPSETQVPTRRISGKQTLNDEIIKDALREFSQHDASATEWTTSMSLLSPSNQLIGCCESLLSDLTEEDVRRWYCMTDVATPVACACLRYLFRQFIQTTYVGLVDNSNGTASSDRPDSLPTLPSTDITHVIVIERNEGDRVRWHLHSIEEVAKVAAATSSGSSNSHFMNETRKEGRCNTRSPSRGLLTKDGVIPDLVSKEHSLISDIWYQYQHFAHRDRKHKLVLVAGKATSKEIVRIDTPVLEYAGHDSNLGKTVKQIVQAHTRGDHTETKRLILGIHQRFWHAPATRLVPLLKASGCPREILIKVPDILQECSRCRIFKPPLSRPIIKTTLARFFGHIVQTDGFGCLGHNFQLLIDECFRYKSGDHVLDRTFGSLYRVLLHTWIRFFGPMCFLITDGESTMAGDDMGLVCDRFHITRVISGSDPSELKRESKHTTTGLVEKHIDLTKLTMLKINADLLDAGIAIEPSDLFAETVQAHNLLLTYNGVSPCVGLMGRQPRDLWEDDNAAHLDLPNRVDQLDPAEVAIRIRQSAKAATLKSVVEKRIADANNTKNTEVQIPGGIGSLVDLYRNPKDKDTPGWRGPAVLLDLDDSGSAVVKWQGRPFNIPLRHLRKHIGFVNLLYSNYSFYSPYVTPHDKNNASTYATFTTETNDTTTTQYVQRDRFNFLTTPGELEPDKKITMTFNLTTAELDELLDMTLRIMDIADATVPGRVYTHGRMYNVHKQQWEYTPDENDSNALKLARQLGVHLEFLNIDGIRFGTGIHTLKGISGCSKSIVIAWRRVDRANHVIHTFPASTKIDLKKLLGKHWDSCSIIQLYRYEYVDEEASELKDYIMPDLSDIDVDSTGGDWSFDFDSLYNPYQPPDGPPAPPRPPRDDDANRSRSRRLRRPGDPDDADAEIDQDHNDGPSPPPPPAVVEGRGNPDLDNAAERSRSRTRDDIPANNDEANESLLPINQQSELSRSRTRDHANDDTNPVLPVLDDSFQSIDEQADVSRSRTREYPEPSSTHQGGCNTRSGGELEDTIEYKDEETAPVAEKKKKDEDDGNVNSGAGSSNDHVQPTNDGPITPILPTVDESEHENQDDDRSRTRDYGNDNDVHLTHFHNILNRSKYNCEKLRSQLQNCGTDFWSEVPKQERAIYAAEVFSTFIPDSSTVEAWNASTAEVVFQGPWSIPVAFYMDVMTGEAFRVDEATDNLSDEDYANYEWEIIEADAKEIKNFLDHDVWRLKLKQHAETRPISCVWVRKWKRKDGKRVIKSRLCVRGFLDPQKNQLSVHSSTATRLSQKLLVSNAANNDFDIESWDISSAFLQGLSFERIKRMCHELGEPLPIVKRIVHIEVPNQAWFHLRNFGFCSWKIDISLYCVQLLKGMYGLNDAPLLWQLCLRHFLIFETGALRSVFDDNYYFWVYPDSPARGGWGNPDPVLQGEATAHVDDGNFTGSTAHLTWLRGLLEKRFGKVSRQTLPYDHVGIHYARVPYGYFLSQSEYAVKIKLIELPRFSKDSDKATAEQTSALRMCVGSLLYLLLTRLDLVADVCLIQTKVCTATVADLRTANSIVRKAHAGKHLGLYYLKIFGEKRVLSYTDSSFATSKTSYAIEGNICGIAPDHETLQYGSKIELVSNHIQGGRYHVLVHSGKRAKRISHGTSHAESLAFYSGYTHGAMIQLRVTELAHWQWLTTEDMKQIDDEGVFTIPHDCVTDCNDLYELLTGHKGIPQDRSQRLIIMSLRELRVTGRIRNTFWCDTTDQLANSLTKHTAYDEQLWQLMEEGLLRTWTKTIRRFSDLFPTDYTENELETMQPQPRKDDDAWLIAAEGGCNTRSPKLSTTL